MWAGTPKESFSIEYSPAIDSLLTGPSIANAESLLISLLPSSVSNSERAPIATKLFQGDKLIGL